MGFAVCSSAAAYLCTSSTLDRVKAHAVMAGNVRLRLVNARVRNSQTTVGAPLLHWQHRSVPRKPYIFLVDLNGGWSMEVLYRTLLDSSLFMHVGLLRSRPGMASVIWESLVSIWWPLVGDVCGQLFSTSLYIYIDPIAMVTCV